MLFLPISVFVILIIYISSFVLVMKRADKKKTERRKNVFIALEGGLRAGTVNDLADVRIIFEGLAPTSASMPRLKFSIAWILKGFLVDLHSGKIGENIDNEYE